MKQNDETMACGKSFHEQLKTEGTFNTYLQNSIHHTLIFTYSLEKPVSSWQLHARHGTGGDNVLTLRRLTSFSHKFEQSCVQRGAVQVTGNLLRQQLGGRMLKNGFIFVYLLMWWSLRPRTYQIFLPGTTKIRTLIHLIRHTYNIEFVV